MKISGLLVILLIMFSCTKDPAGEDLVLVLGTNERITLDEMVFYDTSTHILYFKNYHPELAKYRLIKSTFRFVLEGDIVIYSGDIWPAVLSSLPTGDFSSIFQPDEQIYFLHFQAINGPVNDENLISELTQRNKIRYGLQLSMENLEINGSAVKVNFKITNQDQDRLRCFNPETMGENLFSYYSGGVEFFNLTKFDLIYTGFDTIPSTPPKPQPFWFSILDSKTSKNYHLEFKLSKALPSGTYLVRLPFTGPTYDTSLNDLVKNNVRTWLGSISATSTITIP